MANVAVIYATAPFLAAALGWFLMRETPNNRTLLAAVLSFAGVTIVVGGGFASGRIAGDIVALLMTALCALYIVLIRHFRNTPVVLAGGVSALQLFVVSWALTDPLAASKQDLALLSLFGFSFATAVILWTEGTRLVSAADSALVGTSETPFAILLAWFVLAELPPLASFIGGGIALATVLAYVSSEARTEFNLAKGETK